MKKIYSFLMIILSVFAIAQIHFEKGYFINNNDVKTECLIKNEDWRYNPTSFEYKTEDASETLKADIKNVKVFEIYNESKYLRSTLNIDQSSDNLNKLSTKSQQSVRKPIRKPSGGHHAEKRYCKPLNSTKD